ncbi:helix-hairpin-helix domain-containing protein [Nostoc sp. NIES-2111]
MVAARLKEAADLLAAQSANPYRIEAYRRAARNIQALDGNIGELALKGGRDAIEAIPGVGPAISSAVLQLVSTGRWGYLEQLRGSADPVSLFQTLPGVGPVLARKLHDVLHVETLPELEMAVDAGRLADVPGLGPRKRALLRAAIADNLSRIRSVRGRGGPEPGVSQLLEIDREYRTRADRGDLPKIAPKRFNPTGAAWLPILHVSKGPWSFTALFSNTSRAHQLHRELDWVVIYFQSDHGPEGQRTIVTETHGPMTGLRVVRGREGECLQARLDVQGCGDRSAS